MTEAVGARSREYRKVLIKELRDIADCAPKPQQDWDLVWVLSGPQITYEEPGDSGRNLTRKRLINGFSLVRAVTALRLGKDTEQLTLAEIRKYGPRVYFNGYDESNDALRQTAERGLLEGEQNFPRENLIIGVNEGIMRTQEQFIRFPKSLATKSRKVVVVTDAYHLLRVKRYASMDYNPIPLKKLVYYPSHPIKLPLATTANEIMVKIPDYVEKGYLPKFPKNS